MALPIYINLAASDLRNARARSETDLRSIDLPQFVAGDSLDLNLYVVDQSGLQNIQDYASVRVGIGGSDSRPNAGTYTIATSNTLNYNHSAAELEAIIDSAVADAEVTELAPFVFKIQFTANGTQSIPDVDGRLLNPRSTVDVARMITGDSSTPETWLWRLYQNPIAFTSTFTNISGNGVSGTLDLNTSGVYDLLSSQESKETFFEVELTSSSGNITTVLQAELVMLGEVIGQSFNGTVPQPTGLPAEASAFLQTFPNPTIAGNATFSGGTVKLDNSTSNKVILENGNLDQAKLEISSGIVTLGAFDSAGSGGTGNFLSADVYGTDTSAVTLDAGDGTLNLNGDEEVALDTKEFTVDLPAQSNALKVSQTAVFEEPRVDIIGDLNVTERAVGGGGKVTLKEIRCIGETSGTAQPINYDSLEHRFRDYDGSVPSTGGPTNLLVINKFNGYTGARVAINNDPSTSKNVALLITPGKNASTDEEDLALEVQGGAFFEDFVRVGHYATAPVDGSNNPTLPVGSIIFNTTSKKFQGNVGSANGGWKTFQFES
mgnify:CR=1 FL=1